MAETFELANLPEMLYRLRISTRSISGRSRARQRLAFRQAVEQALERKVNIPSPKALGRFYWRQALDEVGDDNPNTARNYLSLAISANPELMGDAQWLAQAAVYHAFELSCVSLDTAREYDAGFAFLENLTRLLPAGMALPPALQGWMQGELSAAHAFAAARSGDGKRTRSFCVRAWRSDKTHRRNRGLISVFLRSFAFRSSVTASLVP
jgi:hypothetical protein